MTFFQWCVVASFSWFVSEALYLQTLLLLTESGSGSTERDPLGGRPVLVPVELDDEG